MRAPRQALAFLAANAALVALALYAGTRPWIGELDSEVFAIRQKAHDELLHWGDPILGLVDKAAAAPGTSDSETGSLFVTVLPAAVPVSQALTDGLLLQGLVRRLEAAEARRFYVAIPGGDGREDDDRAFWRDT